jgi:VIT1/CCC1 family predicted Fe2+/Mn2+ transporter
MSLIHNEQVKLTATYLNGLAIAQFALGAVAPILSYAFGSIAGQPLRAVSVAAAICLAISAALHLIARRILRNLIP